MAPSQSCGDQDPNRAGLGAHAARVQRPGARAARVQTVRPWVQPRAAHRGRELVTAPVSPCALVEEEEEVGGALRPAFGRRELRPPRKLHPKRAAAAQLGQLVAGARTRLLAAALLGAAAHAPHAAHAAAAAPPQRLCSRLQLDRHLCSAGVGARGDEHDSALEAERKVPEVARRLERQARAGG
eukprot:1242939-Prymnesium_polylepis.1